MAPTGTRIDPYPQFLFVVEIGTAPAAGFMECSGLTTDTDIIDYREGIDPTHMRKLRGLRKYTNVVLKKGHTKDIALWQWRQNIIADQPLERRNLAIILRDEQQRDVLRWNITNAWISKWETGALNAKTNDVAIETVELVHEGLELELEPAA